MEEKDALTGIRVVDFTWVLAGPQATRILADFGAQVIKIENPERPDFSRSYGPAREGTRPPENSGYYNNHNRSKLGITLNVKHLKGQEIIRRLIAISDVVIENFSSRVMENLGLGYGELVKIKPDIIYVSMAGLGHAGPDHFVQTWGPTVQALSGLTFLSGLPGQQAAGWGFSYMDHTGGYYGAMAVLLAIYARNRTGQGQYIDLAQVEAAATLTGPAILEFFVNGRPSRRPGIPNGNRLEHPSTAPHGVYRCAGVDRWCAIAVFTDEEWEALCKAMGNPVWTNDPKFSTRLARVANQDELDCLIEEWTVNYDPHDLMRLLQSMGVRAGAVQNAEDLTIRDPQIEERKLWVELDHPEVGRAKFDGIPIKLSETPGKLRRHGPLIGQDNDYVYGEILGMSPEEIKKLAEEKVI
ncbi:MAG: CoA transferase [Candidatus Tectomicrobia bacterium]|nr:CoA transferase [Candidatus Tectomicrobia bacterium]